PGVQATVKCVPKVLLIASCANLAPSGPAKTVLVERSDIVPSDSAALTTLASSGVIGTVAACAAPIANADDKQTSAASRNIMDTPPLDLLRDRRCRRS